MEIKLVMIGQKFISYFLWLSEILVNHAEKYRTVKLKCDKLKPKCVCVCVCVRHIINSFYSSDYNSLIQYPKFSTSTLV